MPSNTFWTAHVIHDVVGAYYAHPEAWNELGWGGPRLASRVRPAGLDRRDPWEPEEAEPGDEDRSMKKNQHVR